MKTVINPISNEMSISHEVSETAVLANPENYTVAYTSVGHWVKDNCIDVTVTINKE